MSITLTFWNKWVPVRKESYADGTTSLYFGFGRLTWDRPVRLSATERDHIGSRDGSDV